MTHTQPPGLSWLCLTLLIAMGCSSKQTIDYQKQPYRENPQFINLNNKIYTPGKSFVYSYIYTKYGDTLYCQLDEQEPGHWKFSSLKNHENNIENIYLTIQNDTSNHGQTKISYEYILNNGEKAPIFETTGLIENDTNIWMHPPRSYLFKILETAPFPYYRLHHDNNSSWGWHLDIGEFWSDERWLAWKGTHEFIYEYYLDGQTQYKEIETCTVIQSKAFANVGESSLRALFNQDTGFSRLEYVNMDHSKLIIDLIEVK